ncbi:MAG TPA: hypothetical protein PKL83_05030 [bacterium]|nr:hypothetical protein [bacterium]
MTFTTGLIIMMIVLFALNLIVLFAYIGPILVEAKKIMQDVEQITEIVQTRASKIDRALDKASSLLNIVDKFSGVADKVGKIKKKRRKNHPEDDTE